MLRYNNKLKQRSQQMRNDATPQEDVLWFRFLRKHPIRFSRQKPIDQYVADFYCASKRLVIEIDGHQHYTRDGIEYDAIRTATLAGLGLRVLRFTNDEIDHEFGKVCNVIQQALDAF